MAAIRDHHFSTERLVVNEWHSFTGEEWTRSDLTVVVQEVLSDSVTQSLPPEWQGSYSTARASQWIEQRDEEGVTLLVVNKESAKPIGLVILFESDTTGELRLGYMLAESAWGKGYASELIGGFVDWCKNHAIQSVVGGVERNNIASRRVLEKNGFIEVTEAGGSDEQLFRIAF